VLYHETHQERYTHKVKVLIIARVQPHTLVCWTQGM